MSNDLTAKLYDAAKAGQGKEAADDKSVDEAGYMLDSNDCIAIVRQEFARATVAATPAPAPVWQPIETAPKDGSNVLLLEEWETEPFVGYWWESRSKWRASTTHYDTDGDACVIDRIYSEGVTHWMPLPAAPEAGQGKEAA